MGFLADGSVLADTENRAEEVDKIKKEQLRKQKEGKGHWEDELASNSESIVRFPTHPLNPHPSSSSFRL